MRIVSPGDYSDESCETAAFCQRLINAANLEGNWLNWQWLVALRAADTFALRLGHAPGDHDSEIESDQVQLREYVNSLLTKIGIGDGVVEVEELVGEMCRFGGCEIHTVAAFMGGAVAQEVIKLITGQYIPVCNTFLYNGINGQGCTGLL